MANASQRKEIRRAEKDSAAYETLRIAHILNAMSTRNGRAWFYDLLASCHIFNDPFTGDALLEAYSKGERNVGLKVYNDIVTNCPDLFVMMTQEANERDLKNDRANASRTDPEFNFDDPDGAADDELAGSEDGNGGTPGPIHAVDPIYGARV